MQKKACRNSRKIIDENIRLYGELEIVDLSYENG